MIMGGYVETKKHGMKLIDRILKTKNIKITFMETGPLSTRWNPPSSFNTAQHSGLTCTLNAAKSSKDISKHYFCK